MAKKRTDLKIPYGVSDFRTIRNEGLYYVDKTEYLAQMEARDRFIFFVRPRRFGKSLFISMMESYYDLNQKKNFKKLFGDLWIGKHPTENANRFMTLKLDFSKVGGTDEALERAFEDHIGKQLDDMVLRYPSCFDAEFRASFAGQSASGKLADVVNKARRSGIPLYLVIDEYDNFTNQMIRASGVTDYREITHGAGFYRNWFKKFKGDFDRIFMTGVSPVTLDDLTSGFNIATNLSLDADCNAALGFSTAEAVKMFSDFKGTGRFVRGDPAAIVESIKPWYDGYCFAEEKVGAECVFNSDMTLYYYYLKSLVEKGEPPKNMVDANIKTDYDKLKTISDLQRTVFKMEPLEALPMTEQVVAKGGVQFSLVESFPAEAIVKPENFRSLFFYYGLLSMTGWKTGRPVFGVPNNCVEKQVYGYLRDRYFPPSKSFLDWDDAAFAFAYDGRRRGAHAGVLPVRDGASAAVHHVPGAGDVARQLRLLPLPGASLLRRRDAQLHRRVQVRQEGREEGGAGGAAQGGHRAAEGVREGQEDPRAREGHDVASRPRPVPWPQDVQLRAGR